MEVKKGNIVKVHYTGKTGDEVFDSSQGKDPLMFRVGDKKVIPGFEAAVEGMAKGEKKTITIKKEEAYGDRNEKLITEVPKEQLGNLPDDVKLEKGVKFQLQDPSGQVIIASVEEVKDNAVVLDLNHPLAGKDLTFDIEVVDVMQSDDKDDESLENAVGGEDEEAESEEGTDADKE